MRKLIDGLHDFQENVFQPQREFFENLTHGQSPEALFITCSDSRVNPNLITQTRPGDLFIVRNAGNIIPAYGLASSGEAATIEYAVAALKVEHIIVCGHSGCGAMQALLDASKTEAMPTVRAWLDHAEATRRIVRNSYAQMDPEGQLNVAVQENVLVQIEHLRTLPSVAAALATSSVHIHGWVYKMETGVVFAYDAAKRQFLPITSVPESAVDKRSRPPAAI